MDASDAPDSATSVDLADPRIESVARRLARQSLSSGLAPFRTIIPSWKSDRCVDAVVDELWEVWIQPAREILADLDALGTEDGIPADAAR